MQFFRIHIPSVPFSGVIVQHYCTGGEKLPGMGVRMCAVDQRTMHSVSCISGEVFQGRVTYELILSSLQLFLKKLVFLRAILYNEAWEKNFMP